MNDVVHVVVSPIPGIRSVPAQRRGDYANTSVAVGEEVTNVRNYPFEPKKFFAEYNGQDLIFSKDTLKRKPKTRKKSSDEEE